MRFTEIITESTDLIPFADGHLVASNHFIKDRSIKRNISMDNILQVLHKLEKTRKEELFKMPFVNFVVKAPHLGIGLSKQKDWHGDIVYVITTAHETLRVGDLEDVFYLEEETGTRLKDLAKIATNMPDADFWLIRKGSDKTVGKPVKEFDPSRIGIKVVRTDVLDPNYLYYVMMHLHNQGQFARIANGTTNLVNITVNDIANIPLGQQGMTEAGSPAQQAAIAINMKKHHKKPKSESLNEFVSDDGDEEESLRKYAKLWYNGDDTTQQQVEKILARMGWEIGEIESEEGGAFVVQSGDMNGDSYIGFTVNDLTESTERYTKMKIEELITEGENWSKHNNPRAGGMSKKSVKSYRRSHPGSKIQTAVTTKPSKLKKGSKAAKRRASFCARMRGMKKHRTGAKTANDPNSNINKSLRRWHCESIEQMQELVMLAEQKIRDLKK